MAATIMVAGLVNRAAKLEHELEAELAEVAGVIPILLNTLVFISARSAFPISHFCNEPDIRPTALRKEPQSLQIFAWFLSSAGSSLIEQPLDSIQFSTFLQLILNSPFCNLEHITMFFSFTALVPVPGRDKAF
jgi:hypothetical protein